MCATDWPKTHNRPYSHNEMMMQRRRAPLFLVLSVLLSACFFTAANAFHVRSLMRVEPVSKAAYPPRRGVLFNNRGGDIDVKIETGKPSPSEIKDYSGQASALFGMVRIPASLFAGASAAAAFALPIAPTDGVVVGFVKRLYALLMLGALSSQLLAIVVSTTAMATMAYFPHAPTTSLDAFIRKSYDFEWVTILTNFFFGMLSFVFGSGIRAWISIGCPIVAQAALGIIVSSTLLAISFLNDSYSKRGESLLQLPVAYGKYLLQNARQNPLFAVSVLLLVTTHVYIAIKIPHMYAYLSSSKSMMD